MLRSTRRIAALTACAAALASAGAGVAQAQTPAPTTPVGELGIDEFSVKALD